MKSSSPIGIFDSGLGGLTVAKRVMERLPGRSIAYLGDQAHLPYGERSPEEIRSFALGITDFLIKQQAELIIMACNMSSATALNEAREMFPHVSVIGVIDAGARTAVRLTSGGPIGVLATTGTVKTEAYTRTLQRLVPDIEVVEQACPRFVPLVEAGMCDSPEAEEAVRDYTGPLLDAGCRTLILGCTHYPFLMPVIQRVVGGEVRIIDPSEETAFEAAEILGADQDAQSGIIEPVHIYYTTGSPEQFAELGGRFMESIVEAVTRISWGSDIGEIEWQEKMVGRTMRSAL